MRLIEILLVVLASAGAVALLLGRPGRASFRGSRVFLALAICLLAAQLWWEGPHWQMFPVDAALGLAGWKLLRSSDSSPRRKYALTVLVLCAAGLGLGLVAPLFPLPLPTGAYATGTRTLYLVDPGRQSREIVAQLWYPAQPVGTFARYVRPAEIKPLFRYLSLIHTNSYQDAPFAPPMSKSQAFPVLIFGGMWGGRRTQDTFLAEDLASHGYVVLAVDHPGNSFRVQLRDGRVIKSTMADALSAAHVLSAEAFESTWKKELEVWTEDNEFGLNALADANRNSTSPFYGRLNLERVGAFGHSFGGAASLRLLGLDPRVKAAVNMDGWTLGGLATRTTQPILLLYSAPGSQIAEPPFTGNTMDDQLARADHAEIDPSLERFGGYRAFLSGTQHLDFTDQTLVSPLQRLTFTGPLKGERMRQITRALVLGFFNQTLTNSGSIPTFPEVHWTHRYP